MLASPSKGFGFGKIQGVFTHLSASRTQCSASRLRYGLESYLFNAPFLQGGISRFLIDGRIGGDFAGLSQPPKFRNGSFETILRDVSRSNTDSRFCSRGVVHVFGCDSIARSRGGGFLRFGGGEEAKNYSIQFPEGQLAPCSPFDSCRQSSTEVSAPEK